MKKIFFFIWLYSIVFAQAMEESIQQYYPLPHELDLSTALIYLPLLEIHEEYPQLIAHLNTIHNIKIRNELREHLMSIEDFDSISEEIKKKMAHFPEALTAQVNIHQDIENARLRVLFKYLIFLSPSLAAKAPHDFFQYF